MMNRRTFLHSTFPVLLASPLFSQTTTELACDVAIIGASVGGVAASLAALRNGMRVVLTEETDWIGGQLTSQAVPPDEHPWIEEFGCTASYRAYRNAVRQFYRDHYPLTSDARNKTNLNPGNGTVSRLTHEFKVSVAVLNDLLAPYLGSGQLTLLLEHTPAAAQTAADRIESVTVRDLRTNLRRVIRARCFLDATDLGDLLPLVHAEYVTGAESQSQTGELHAPSEPQPGNSQSFTFCFAMDYLAGEDHTISRPDDYQKWRDYVPNLTPPWTGKLLNWIASEPRTLKPRNAYFDPTEQQPDPRGLNLWMYRRIVDPANFVAGFYKSGITLVNWPQNDFWLADLVTAGLADREKLLAQAKGLSFAFLYWMQTEAPRPDGGAGWKGLRLRNDIVGTEDGMAKAPYVRESRRIKAEFTIREQHVGTQMRMQETHLPIDRVAAETFFDTVGVGCYRIDLHPSAGGTNYIDVSSVPFQVPLGALIPERLNNLLAACKNIGTTHISNGCYRLHPVEWNIGEAAGAVAAFAIQKKETPRAIRNNRQLLDAFQSALKLQGFELAWPQIRPV